MRSFIALLIVACCSATFAADVNEDPPLPIVDVAAGAKCNCCDACQCDPCKCKETGVRCTFDCTCAPCLMTYCCKHCGCKQFRFPAGRKCEPIIMCDSCRSTRTRGSLKQLKPVPKRQPMAARVYQSRPCST